MLKYPADNTAWLVSFHQTPCCTLQEYIQKVPLTPLSSVQKTDHLRISCRFRTHYYNDQFFLQDHDHSIGSFKISDILFIFWYRSSDTFGGISFSFLIRIPKIWKWEYGKSGWKPPHLIPVTSRSDNAPSPQHNWFLHSFLSFYNTEFSALLSLIRLTVLPHSMSVLKYNLWHHLSAFFHIFKLIISA